MQPTADADLTVVKISNPADILGVLPHRIGFHPTESLVMVCLEGPRRRDRLVMRVDLPTARAERRFAREMTDRVRQAGASAVALVCYTDAPLAVSQHLARASLVATLKKRLDADKIETVEALLVRGGRWWSYLCADESCCPSAGTPLSSELTRAAGHYAAEAVAHGGVVLTDRATLVMSIEPSSNPVAEAVRAQAACTAGDSLVTVIACDGVEAAGRLAVTTLHRLVAAWSDGCREVTPEDAALIALGLRDKLARDEAMTMVLDHDEGLLVALFTDIVRLVDDVDAAPVCTLLAWTAYSQGRGALAVVAAERALRCDPGYDMAELVLAGLSNMVAPSAIRDVAARVRADLAR